MEILNFKGTDDTPEIILDHSNKIYEISGKSMPEDVATFYEPVLQWLDKLAETVPVQLNFTFKMDYFNTASSKLLLDIMMRMETMAENGISVLIKWHYTKTDTDMKEAGEEFADIVSVPFEIIPL